MKGTLMVNRLAELLEETGIRPAALARMADIQVTTIYEILKGKRKFENVGVSKVIRMAESLGVSVEYLSGIDRLNEDSAVTTLEDEIIQICAMLNKQGREELRTYAMFLTEQDRFTKKDRQDTEGRISETA